MSTVNGIANGARRNGAREKKVRVAIVGVGNCASSFVQGVEYYKKANPDEQVPGLMHVDLGGYHISDIEFTAAFDIDKEKVGKDLSKANGYTLSDSVLGKGDRPPGMSASWPRTCQTRWNTVNVVSAAIT